MDTDRKLTWACCYEELGGYSISSRHYTLKAAKAAVTRSRNAFNRANPSSWNTTPLVGFRVRYLDGKRWVRYEED